MIVQFEKIGCSINDQKNMDESVKDTKKGLFNTVCFRQSRIHCSVRQNQVSVAGTETKV